MTLASDLRNIVAAARPTVEEWIDVGEQFVGFRDACKVKGLDWGQIKALIKAQILDERDGGKRVEKIVEKADFASSYAAMLGLLPGNVNEENFSETEPAASRKAPLESPGSPIAAEGLVSGRDRYVRGHATANVGQREHGQQTALSEDGESHPLKAAEDMTSRGGENPASNSSLEPVCAEIGALAGRRPAASSRGQDSAGTLSHSAPEPSPPAPGAETPRAGVRTEPAARGDIDISIPSFLDRKSPDCIANRAQGRE